MPAPASISSISPQRRSNGQDNPSPFARPTHRTFTYTQQLASPHSYGFGEQIQQYQAQGMASYAVPSVPQHGHRLRDRGSFPNLGSRASSGSFPRPFGAGILPTPDPTVASCISDEDVALQLMRLGDASNISHGRTSASTLDDALSGRADVASSATSESDVDSQTTEQPELPTHQRNPKHEPRSHSQSKEQRMQHANPVPTSDSAEPSDDEVDGDYDYNEVHDGVFKSDPDDIVNEFGQVPKHKLQRSKSVTSNVTKVRSGSHSSKQVRTPKLRLGNIPKSAKALSVVTGMQPPMSPASISQSRKTSSASTISFKHQLGLDEEDLSSKPRCQRCRKSKKGCDRQRPCQRCKDAGIAIDGCVSEDEGNGRKGRYGRHMGVAVKKGEEGYATLEDMQSVGPSSAGTARTQISPDKGKKRKR